MIRPVQFSDATSIAEIYNPYIRDSIITFEEVAVDPIEIVTRIQSVQGLGLPWLVWVEHQQSHRDQIDRDSRCSVGTGERIIGYAYAGKFRERAAYRFTVETAVYLADSRRGKGIGRLLYQALINELKSSSVKRAIGVISLPNPASIQLHESIGFTRVGVLSAAGFKFGQWIDVGLWELDLDQYQRGN